MSDNNLVRNRPDSKTIVSNFFRTEYSKFVAIFAKRYGIDHLDLIEDALQDTMLKAMKVWSYYEIPAKPSHWIFTVTKNYLIDSIKRYSRELPIDNGKSNVFAANIDESFNTNFEHEIRNSQLSFLFMCCHPLLSRESQIILSLKFLFGFEKKEIASALLKSEEAVAKALLRAKSKLRAQKITLQLPAKQEAAQRLPIVLKILYLLFNEGYKVSTGKKLINEDICHESMYLTKALIDENIFESSSLKALLALMCFQASRLKTRVGDSDELLTLEKQDRRKWDQELIQTGMGYLQDATSAKEVSSYHLQAAIACEHCIAADFVSTDWKKILNYYDILIEINPSPGALLNRIIALSKAANADDALEQFYNIPVTRDLQRSHHYFAVKAYLYKELQDVKMEIECLERAIELSQNDVEQRFMQERYSSLLKKGIKHN